MATTLVTFNDLGLRVERAGDVLCESPGIALVADQRVLTGAAAEARAQWQPRAIYSRFWQQLNDTPLPHARGACRHHADLAWHHLGAVLDAAGRPPRAVLAVPGHYGDAELALLLGLCGAQGLEVEGMVDSAVAAVAGVAAPGRYVVCELFRHHTLLTTVEVGPAVTRQAVDMLPEVGLARIRAAAAELAAGALLDQARCDALHEAGSAQSLHDALPAWLEAARETEEVTLTLTLGGRHHHARLASREFERVTTMVLQGVLERLPGDARVLLSPSLAALPGALDLLAPAQVLPTAALAKGIAGVAFERDPRVAAAPYVASLPACATPSLGLDAETAPRRERCARAPTHLLCGAVAHALGETPLYLHADGSVARVARGAAASIRLAPQGALLSPGGLAAHVNGVAVQADARLETGDHITLGASRALYLAIRVTDNSAP